LSPSAQRSSIQSNVVLRLVISNARAANVAPSKLHFAPNRSTLTDVTTLGTAGVVKPRPTAEPAVSWASARALQVEATPLRYRCLLLQALPALLPPACPRTAVAVVALEIRRVKAASLATVSNVLDH
jgi:hypothetical protein